MLFFNEKNETLVLDSVYDIVLSDYFWVLDLNIRDFTLSKLNSFEETISPAIKVKVKNFEFVVPAVWNILLYSEDTQQLDVMEIANLSGRQVSTLVYGHNSSRIKSAHVDVVDYFPSYRNVSPSLSKHQLLCHPIGPNEWINIAPADTYNKYLKNLMVGDLI